MWFCPTCSKQVDSGERYNAIAKSPKAELTYVFCSHTCRADWLERMSGAFDPQFQIVLDPPVNTKRQPEQSLAERYADYQRKINALLSLISEELRARAEDPNRGDVEWEDVDDLSRIRELLKRILESMLVMRYGWPGVEASRFVEDYLADIEQRKK